MEGFGGVLVMSLVMLLGSYIAGSIPLFFSLSEEKLQLVSVMGAGLLVGTALSVIIPEGMQTLNMAYRWSGLHQSMKAFLSTKPFSSIKEHASHHGGEGTEESGHAHQHEENPVPHIIGVSLVLGFIFMLIVDQVPISTLR